MTDHPTLPPDDDRDFEQFTGAFDRPIEPAPAFAERLKRQVANAGSTEGASTMHATTAEPRISRMTNSRVIPMPPSRTSGGSILEIIAAAVLIFALVSSGFYMYRIQNGSSPTDPDGHRLAATTPLASPTSVADEGGTAWTDPGHTNTFPAGFDPETAQPTETVGDIDFQSNSGIIVGDTLILTGLPADVDPADTPIDPTITGINLTSGDQLWSEQRAILGNPVAGQDAFHTVEVTEPVDDSFTVKLVSVSPATGATNWEHTLFDLPETAFGSNTLTSLTSRPIAIGDHVYIADGLGEITAFDAASGEIVWQQTEVDYFSDYRAGPFGSLVGDDDYVFVVNYMFEIVKHNARTGEVVDTFSLEHEPHTNELLQLRLSGDKIVGIAQHPNHPPLLEVLDTESGDSLWSIDLGGYPAGSLVLTDDVVGIPQHYSDDATPATANNSFRFIVEFFDLETGELVADYSPAPVQGASLSASGSVVCIHESAQAISCDDMADHQFDPTAIDIGAGLPAEGPPSPVLFWNDNAIVLGHEGGPHIIRSGTVPNKATPISSPSASPATTAPYIDLNHTAAWPAGFDISGPLVAQPLDGYQGYAASGMVVGDTLIAENKRVAHEDSPTFSGTGIYAQDLRTGEILWRNTDQIHQRYTADASGVYILPQPMTNNQHLIALDLETGEERWRSESLIDYSAYPESAPFLHATTPIAIDGTVYIPFVDGSVIAFNGETGDIAWRYIPETIADMDDMRGNASISGTSDRIYIAGGDNVISVLDRESGSLIREIMLDSVPAPDYGIWLYASERHLVVEARNLYAGGTAARLIAVDPETGNELWDQDTGVMQSNVLVTPTTTGVMHARFDDPTIIERIVLNRETEGTLHLSLFDINTGESIDVPDGVFSPLDGVWSGALASSGEVICVAYTTVTCFDPDENVETIEGFETEEVSSAQALLFWNDRLLILDAREPIHITEP